MKFTLNHLVIALLLFTACSTESEKEPVYMDRNASVSDRVESLLKQMTLEEKVGQMTQINNSEYAYDYSQAETESAPPDVGISIDTAKYIAFIEDYHIGSFLNGVAVSPEIWASYSRTIQELALEHSRLKIPIIYGIDHVHGTNYIEYGTIFPHSLNLAATFDTTYSYQEGRIAALESAHLGHHWIFNPVMDLGKNPYWPRLYETYGEDPLLAAKMGVAYVHALQHNPETAPYYQAATAKHFIGYGDPRGGWDRTPSEISEQTLQEFHIPPFKAVIDAGIKTLMVQGGEVNGIPVHASRTLLTEVLREQLGFEGVVVTDWEDVIRLHKWHGVTENMKESVYTAVMAGIDMSMTPYTTSFYDELITLVKEGRIPESRIDASVSRILKLKFELGLFEHPFPDLEANRVREPEFVEIALNAARESLVLLKNDNILPLKAPKKLVVTGCNAHSKKGLAGGWTLRWIPDADSLFPADMLTVFTGLKEQYPDTEIVWAEGNSLGAAAASADAIIVATGEEPYAENQGNIGDLSLHPEELELIKAAIQLNKPVILVMIAGRPRIVSDVLPDCDAFIWAGLPGFEGGRAIAEIISGKANPSGKLPFSYPAQPGHWYPYNHKQMEEFFMPEGKDGTVHTAVFGDGLSYSKFSYSDINLEDSLVQREQTLKADITVKNTGSQSGKVAVLWFLQDEVASITRPVRSLVHFEKVYLEPGESKEIFFNIIPEKHLTFASKGGEEKLEPGYFKIIAGNKSIRFRYQ